MRLIEANGVRLAVRDEGTGTPPFLFIHGLACNQGVWEEQLQALGPTHRCVSIDLRGCGASPAAFPCNVETAAADVAAVAEALALPPAIVVGHSLGGLVALALNDRAPERVLGLVLIDSPIGNPPAPPSGGGLRASLLESGSTAPLEPLVERFFVEETPDEVRAAVRAMMLGCPVDVVAGMLDNAGLDDRWDQLIREADRKPFMALWAERPLGNPNRLRELALFLRQEPVAGAGHFVQVERPDITTALLRAFLDDVARDPRLTTDGNPS